MNTAAKNRLYQAILAASCGIAAVSANAANTHQTFDPQEITAFNSGYDISRVEYTLIDNETLQIDLIPYGVPGDADGDGDPDASSNGAISDSPGVSGLESIYMGMICNYTGGPCEPNLNISIFDNVLTATSTSGNDVSANLSFQIIDAIDNDGKLDTYRLTINNLSAVRLAVLGSVPATIDFGSFTYSAHFDDAQPDDLVPDADPNTGEVMCETISLSPPVTNAPGTGTIGYWKTHPGEWPANCDVTMPVAQGTTTNGDPISFAMGILEAPVKGDKSISMAKQLIAAKLNVCAGNDASCITSTMTSAMNWLNTYGGVGAKLKSWNGGDEIHDTLDDYNNGKLCAPHRD